MDITDPDKQTFKDSGADGSLINKIKCSSCGKIFLVHTDGMKMPARQVGYNRCECGQTLIEYNLTEELEIMGIED